jgi:hypothetical protein
LPGAIEAQRAGSRKENLLMPLTAPTPAPDHVSRAVRRVVAERHFECSACRFAAPVHVSARGSGEHASSAPGPSSAAFAARRAEVNAWNLARARFQALSCPRCGARGAEVRKAVEVRRAVASAALFLGLVMALLGSAMSYARHSSEGAPWLVMLGVLVALAGLATFVRVDRSPAGPSGANQFAQFGAPERLAVEVAAGGSTTAGGSDRALHAPSS